MHLSQYHLNLNRYDILSKTKILLYDSFNIIYNPQFIANVHRLLQTCSEIQSTFVNDQCFAIIKKAESCIFFERNETNCEVNLRNKKACFPQVCLVCIYGICFSWPQKEKKADQGKHRVTFRLSSSCGLGFREGM